MNTTRRAMAGFTLVELMIALVLGLLVIAGVGSVFLANKDAYRTNEALAQVQDAARTSFEYLARDIRAAGMNVCGAATMDSVLNPGNSLLNLASLVDPIQGWSSAPSGFGLPGSGAGKPVANTAVLRVAGSQEAGLVLADSTVGRSQIELAGGSAGVEAGNVLTLCDINRAVIFQVTGMDSNVIEHDPGTTGDDNAPGNNAAADTFLNDPEEKEFAPSSYLAVPTNHLWYVGENDAGGRSLYRHGLGAKGVETTEMVRGLKADDTNDWNIQYHERNADDFVGAGSVSNWNEVDAIRFTITAQSRGINPDDPDLGAGTERERLERTFTTTIAIRSRMGES